MLERFHTYEKYYTKILRKARWGDDKRACPTYNSTEMKKSNNFPAKNEGREVP